MWGQNPETRNEAKVVNQILSSTLPRFPLAFLKVFIFGPFALFVFIQRIRKGLWLCKE